MATRIGLSRKIIAWSFIPTAFILLLVALTTYRAYTQVTQQLVIRQEEELTRLSASEVSASLQEYVDRLTAMARLPEIYQNNPEQQRSSLVENKNQLVLFDGGVYLLNNFGEVVATMPAHPDLIGQDWSNRSFFQSMIRTPGLKLTNIEPFGPFKEDVIVMAVPILSERVEFRGVVAGMFRLNVGAVSPFYGTLLKLRIIRNGTAYLLDGNQRVIYAPDFNLIGKVFSALPDAAQAAAGQIDAIRTRLPDGRDIVMGFAPVPRTNWTLIAEENWSDLIRLSPGYQRYLLLLLALGVILPTIVVMVGVRRITGPISDFIAAAQRIAGGDFNHSIQVKTGDEMEELADQFNVMTVHLRDSYETLETRVADRTHELSAVNSVAAVVSRSLNLDQILPDALAKTIEVMEMEGGAVYRLDSGSNSLILAAQQGLSDEFVGVVAIMPLEASIINEVVQSMQPQSRLVSEYPPGPIRASLEKDGWKIVVSIPLVAQEKVIGAMNVASRKLVAPPSEKLAVPAAIGQQIGIAMDNARLYAQTVEYTNLLEGDLQLALQVQSSLLPHQMPVLDGWQVSAYWQPSRAVSGDFYDFIQLPDDRLGLLVADVSGKGMPAALVMAYTHSVLRSIISNTTHEGLCSPGSLLTKVNDILCDEMPKNMFVTCLLAILHPPSGQVCYANAGHNLPYERTIQEVVQLRATGLPLGLFPGMDYEDKEVFLNRGESLVMYSDGLVEAHNSLGEMFGNERLEQYLEHQLGNGYPGKDLIQFLMARLAEFTGLDWEQEDDVTLVVLEHNLM